MNFQIDELRKEVKELEEFKEVDISSMSYEELGAILGYWDVGGGEVEE